MQRILLVEDDILLAFPVEEVLLEAGYAVETVNRSEDALKALHTTAYSALVTDIRLGPGPDGWEVARRGRELNLELPVVYMTADSAAAWEAHGVPGSVMLRKPFLLEHLLRELHRVIHA